MAQTYKVQFANKLDGQDQYGNVTYSVKFESEADSCLVRVKGDRVVTPGQEMYGRIDSLTSKTGKPYKKFVREQQDDQSGGFKPRSTGGQDRGDGMRQGMSINNAAAYIIHLSEKGAEQLSAEEWAKKVVDYARALYIRSEDIAKEADEDLKKEVMEAFGSDQPVDLSEIPDFS